MTKIKQLRLRCFFDVTIAEDNIGRVVFELFNDVCPKTCENFKALCTGERGDGKFTGKPLHYKNVSFHRVVKNFMIQSGDFSQGNGKGGESIYGGTFEDETFELKHQEPYLLSMANRGKNTNGSQFFITLAPAPHLDGVHVVFGHVISGQDVIDNIANQAVDKHSKPLVDIRIANCGELIPQIKPKESKKKSKSKSDNEESDESSDDSSASDSSSGSDSESDSTSEGEIDRISKKKNGNENSKDSKNDNVAIPISDLPNAPKIYSNIKADEIPEVPPNRFLARSFKPKEQDNDDREDREDKRREGKEYVRKFSYSKSGRKIKGRGFIRYRTPSPEDNRFSSRFRRSETPPHWKSAQSKLKTFKEAISQSSKDSVRSRENSRNRHRNDDRSWRNRRSRSRSRERFHNRSSRRDSSQRDHSLNRRSSRSQESRSPRRERKHSESSSPVAAKIKEQKENLNENSATSGKHDRDLTTHDRNSSRNKHDREKNSFSKNTDKSTSKRSRDDSD